MFEVEQILGVRRDRKSHGRQFYIKWHGYEDNSWEPEKNIRHTSVYEEWKVSTRVVSENIQMPFRRSTTSLPSRPRRAPVSLRLAACAATLRGTAAARPVVAPARRRVVRAHRRRSVFPSRCAFVTLLGRACHLRSFAGPLGRSALLDTTSTRTPRTTLSPLVRASMRVNLQAP